MVKKAMGFLIGGNSQRFQMTIIYLVTFVALSVTKTLEPVAFATFSGLFGVWIIGDTIRKPK